MYNATNYNCLFCTKYNMNISNKKSTYRGYKLPISFYGEAEFTK